MRTMLLNVGILSASYSGVLQMLDVSGAVTVLHPPGHNPEAFSPHSVHDRSPVGKEVDAPDDQHAAVVDEPAARDEGWRRVRRL